MVFLSALFWEEIAYTCDKVVLLKVVAVSAVQMYKL